MKIILSKQSLDFKRLLAVYIINCHVCLKYVPVQKKKKKLLTYRFWPSKLIIALKDTNEILQLTKKAMFLS